MFRNISIKLTPLLFTQVLNFTTRSPSMPHVVVITTSFPASVTLPPVPRLFSFRVHGFTYFRGDFTGVQSNTMSVNSSHPILFSVHFYERSGSATCPPVMTPSQRHNPLSHLLAYSVWSLNGMLAQTSTHCEKGGASSYVSGTSVSSGSDYSNAANISTK